MRLESAAADAGSEYGVVHLANELGARPFLLFVMLVGVALTSSVALFFTLRWSAVHARGVWRFAVTKWRRLARRPLIQRAEVKFPTVWRFMRTLTATEYFVVHAAIGFVVALSCVGFLAIADEVVEEDTAVRVDLELAASLHRSASPATVRFFRIFTFLGGGIGIAIVGVAVGILLLRRGRNLLAAGWAIALLGVGALNAALKAAFARPRPSFDNPWVTPNGWSFPSGHSMGTWVAAGMLAYLWIILRPRNPSVPRLGTPMPTMAQWVVVCCAIAFSVAMGFSRLLLGAHYLTDVIGGFAAGTVWLGACISGIEVARRRPLLPKQG
ncbi:MAG: phosphatase PAP2 family protein [Polyangiaceae bacterium]|nr:phosphatase PAP2 family protein [Polyangiaceae bacterium]